ncbi:MAG: M60 family metallopeptidase, partial [Deltaproteobacteria bacterium]|nr:M60 family metallopeptidase [Deltaproteobacteria bacterium]
RAGAALTLAVAAAGCPRAFCVDAAGPADAAALDAPGPDAALEQRESLRAPLVQGVTLIQADLRQSRVSASDQRLVPIVWGSPRASGGDKLGLPGTMPAPGWAGRFGSGRLVVWAGHEAFFGDDADGRHDNDLLRQNILGWLLGEGRRVGFAGTHREWLTLASFSPALKSWLAVRGVTASDIGAALDAPVLARYDLVVIGNPWGAWLPGELDALALWVHQGGRLLVLGLGWSWPTYNGDPDNRAYPVNQLGERFGFRVENSSIVDPATAVGSAASPGFAVLPLAEYLPKTVRVLKQGRDDVDQIKILGPESPATLYVIEGQHMGLNLLPNDWPLLNDPTAALVALDKIYGAELALAGGAHPPFNGDVVWAVAVDDPDGPYWMHSGNPIVFKQQAGRSEIIPTFNREGYPGWGLGHEQGHNMHIEACRNLFVVEGTAETWANVFNVYSYLHNGWSWATAQRGDIFAAGHAYHAQASPSFDLLTSDPWVLLGCLELIWTRYGWGGMQAFLAGAAADGAAGTSSGDDAARSAYLVERMSIAYGVDLAPLFAHWGFTVSSATRTATGGLPPCDIGW